MVDRNRRLRVNPVAFREHVLMTMLAGARHLEAGEIAAELRRRKARVPAPSGMGEVHWLALFLRKMAKAGLVCPVGPVPAWTLTTAGRELAAASVAATHRMTTAIVQAVRDQGRSR